MKLTTRVMSHPIAIVMRAIMMLAWSPRLYVAGGVPTATGAAARMGIAGQMPDAPAGIVAVTCATRVSRVFTDVRNWSRRALSAVERRIFSEVELSRM